MIETPPPPRALLSALLSALLLVFGIPCGAAAMDRPPNVVLILVDDLGWTDFGCFGSRWYETPRIDRLRANGMRFTDAYSSGPNCAPTRACLLSGLWPPRHGIYTVGSGARGAARFRKLRPVDNATTLDPAFETLPELLRRRGYFTAHIGKWHLGEPGTAGPLEHGFDVNVGGTHAGHPSSYFSPYRNRELPDGPKGEYLTDRLSDEAVRLIGEHADQPFFLYLAHYAVHTPIQAKAEDTERFRRKPPVDGHSNAEYAAMIASLDGGVGRVLDALEAKGLTERTLVILTSDNGGLGGYRREGLRTNDVTDNAPLRGGKGMLYEGGVRVPLIVSWPGVIEAGAECREPVSSIDFFPTILDVAGVDTSARPALDGQSLAPLLRGSGRGRLEREGLFWHFPGYLQANARDGSWRTTPASSVRRGRYKLIEFFEDGRLELFDLERDPGETRDLADIDTKRRDELLGILKSWRQRVRAPLPRAKGAEDESSPPVPGGER